jgi:hypothetical protein
VNKSTDSIQPLQSSSSKKGKQPYTYASRYAELFPCFEPIPFGLLHSQGTTKSVAVKHGSGNDQNVDSSDRNGDEQKNKQQKAKKKSKLVRGDGNKLCPQTKRRPKCKSCFLLLSKCVMANTHITLFSGQHRKCVTRSDK